MSRSDLMEGERGAEAIGVIYSHVLRLFSQEQISVFEPTESVMELGVSLGLLVVKRAL